jgi:peptide/nickel transport system substrate-binding protein
VAQIIQQSWAKIGVTVKVLQLDDSTASDKFVTGTYDLIIGEPGTGMSDVPVEDEFAQLIFDSPETHNLFTFSGVTDATRYARQAIHEPDEKKRAEAFANMHVASMEDPSSVPLVYTPNRAAASNNVHAFNYMLCGWFLLDDAWLQH